jgi:hypothetical protein
MIQSLPSGMEATGRIAAQGGGATPSIPAAMQQSVRSRSRRSRATAAQDPLPER